MIIDNEAFDIGNNSRNPLSTPHQNYIINHICRFNPTGSELVLPKKPRIETDSYSFYSVRREMTHD
jgi:hypothetical protein